MYVYIIYMFSWFHAGLTRHIAESILMQNGEDGAYLLRPCSKPGELALSVRYVPLFYGIIYKWKWVLRTRIH